MKNETLIKTFVNSIGSNSDHTRTSYTQILTVFVEKIGDIQDVTYEGYVEYKSTLGNLATATQKKHISVTKEFLEWCFINYNIGNSEELFKISKLKSPRGNSKQTQPLTSDEVKRMIDCGKNDRDKAIIALGCVTGLRVNEIIELKMNDIKDGYIEIYGKGNKYRVVYPNDLVMEYINKYTQNMRIKNLAKSGENMDNVFISNGGTKLLESSLNRTLKVISKNAGVNKDVHPHTLRHTCATLMYENGIDVKVIQSNLGHADISTTNRYTHNNVNIIKQRLNSVSLLG